MKTLTNNFTQEQLAIIHSTGDIRINAVAGSGKTTTLIEYAAARPAGSRILYLAFNKSVKLEAVRKFADRGLSNVQVETAHSLAYRHIMQGSGLQVRATGYKTHEIAQLLEFPAIGEKHGEYIIANHINKFITYFCNSDKARVQELDYLDTITDVQAANFVRSFYKYVEDGTRQMLAKMNRGEIELTHDFYLKKFQLSNPQLPYDYILFDEAQDASATMLAVFAAQKATKVMVGDIHQQIYGWRFAENALEKTDYRQYSLSVSFRFPQAIADLATEILEWKNYLGQHKTVSIKGQGNNAALKTKATIARTNLGLLLNAINFMADNPKVKKIYFEGKISSYTYADDGTSLYDVLNLYNSKPDMIRDKMIRTMKDIDELEDYIEKTEDVQLSIMVEIVKEYENEIYDILRDLKDLHVDDEDRASAEMIFSTVHRAKGMEYDQVQLVNDFITELKVEKASEEKDEPGTDLKKMNEEINLLYVAVTRTRNKLIIPDLLMPRKFPPSSHIELMRVKKETFTPEIPSRGGNKPALVKKTKSADRYSALPRNREIKKDAYAPWNPDLDLELKDLYQLDTPVAEIATHFGRTKGAIIARLKKFNYFDE